MTCCMKNTFPVSAILPFSRSPSTHSFNIIIIVVIFCSRHHIWEQGIKRIIPFGNRQAASVLESFLVFSNISVGRPLSGGSWLTGNLHINSGGFIWLVLFLKIFNYTGAAPLQKYSIHTFLNAFNPDIYFKTKRY